MGAICPNRPAIIKGEYEMEVLVLEIVCSPCPWASLPLLAPDGALHYRDPRVEESDEAG